MVATTLDIEMPARDRVAANRRLIRLWLYCVMLVLFTLVLVGGATRLTDSGLSITEWKPIHGVIPPLSEAQWQEELEKYRQIPEYQQINKGMSLDEFKVIYWWEWAHRVLARGVGLVFAVPLFLFWAMGRVESHLKPKLLALLALGGLQGFIGWWMVSSGLTERTDVSQYRLATHLTIAALIFAGLMAVARSLAPHSEGPAATATQRGARWLALLVLFQIYLGGLVAGLDAGLTYATWPLMDERIIPTGLFDLSPWWINLFENPLTVQFIHRSGAYLLFALVIVHALRTIARDGAGSTHARRALLMVALVTLQAVIGIATLLMLVPLHMALMHQGMGFLLLGFAVAHWRGTVGETPLPRFA
ncbi:MAG: COX15/CtaA family protein [Rhizobiaceae bacterium]|nr:COX15/CtaA family protein [Rhizobiaceae bacterium]